MGVKSRGFRWSKKTVFVIDRFGLPWNVERVKVCR